MDPRASQGIARFYCTWFARRQLVGLGEEATLTDSVQMPYSGPFAPSIGDSSSLHWEARRIQMCVDREQLQKQRLREVKLH